MPRKEKYSWETGKAAKARIAKNKKEDQGKKGKKKGSI